MPARKNYDLRSGLICARALAGAEPSHTAMDYDIVTSPLYTIHETHHMTRLLFTLALYTVATMNLLMAHTSRGQILLIT